MDRRTWLVWIAGCVAWVLGCKAVANATTERRLTLKEVSRYSIGGIISLNQTPWMRGTTTFINGVEAKKVQSINCTENYIVVIEPERLYTGLWMPGMTEQVMPTRRIDGGSITVEPGMDIADLEQGLAEQWRRWKPTDAH